MDLANALARTMPCRIHAPFGEHVMTRPQSTKTRRASQARKAAAQPGNDTQDADYTERVIAMLTAEHDAAKRLFSSAEEAADDIEQLQSIVQQACTALTRHAEIEEEFLYPALRRDDPERVAEAQVEHNAAKQLIADLESMDPDDERYRATFTVLGAYVRHHIAEEENEIFPLAREADADFEALCEALSATDLDEGTDAADDAGARAAPVPASRGTRTTPRSRR